jgi:hypothetical protein
VDDPVDATACKDVDDELRGAFDRFLAQRAQTEYLFLLGIPLATLVAAKVITSTQLAMLSGGSAAAYLAKKAASREAPPEVTAVFPNPVAGDPITIVSRNLVQQSSLPSIGSDSPISPEGDERVWVLIGGQPAAVTKSETNGQLDVLKATAPGAVGEMPVVVLTRTGATSPPQPVSIQIPGQRPIQGAWLRTLNRLGVSGGGGRR